MASSSKTRLGRGLGAIISGGKAAPAKKAAAASPKKTTSVRAASGRDAAAKDSGGSSASGSTAASAAPATPVPYQEIKVALIEPNPYQPRREFKPEQIEELAESIRAEGLLQPVVVRKAGEKYQLIAGERRWRAFQALKLRTIPARVVSVSDASAASMALIENLQRENLNPIEEAHGYASLIRDFDLTQEQVAERVGKGRATIANALRLLNLSEEIQGYVSTGLLSAGHAKALLGVENKAEQLVLARRVIQDGLSVRATEALVNAWQRGRSGRASSGRKVPPAEEAAIQDIERRFSSFLNARVQLQHSPKKGKIVIEYQGNEDLQRILEKLGVGT